MEFINAQRQAPRFDCRLWGAHGRCNRGGRGDAARARPAADRADVYRRAGGTRGNRLSPQLPGLSRHHPRQWRVRRSSAQGRLLPRPLGRGQRRGALRIHERDNAAGSAWSAHASKLCRSHRIHPQQQWLPAGRQGAPDRRRRPAEDDVAEIAWRITPASGTTGASLSDLTLTQVAYRLCAMLLLVAVHGATVAATACALGDPGPRYDGRLRASPLVHLDLLGLLSGVLFAVGWSKPVA